MRIRKRSVPLPLSSLVPVPISLSDPHLINRSAAVVQLQLNQASFINTAATTGTSTKVATPNTVPTTFAAAKSSPPPQDYLSLKLTDNVDTVSSHSNRQLPDDHQPPQLVGKSTDGLDSSCLSLPVKQEENGGYCLDLLPMREGSKQEKDNNTIYSIEEDILRSGAAEVLAQSNPSQQEGKCCMRGKAFPSKKARGSFEGRGVEEIPIESNKKLKTKKKCSNVQSDITPIEENGEREEGKEGAAAKLSGSETNKKRTRGTTLLEGSRCSRVNGRGWRCCQQTLVGYSLCEHHLGKGRLRSMASVRSKSCLGSSSTTSKNIKSDQTSSPAPSLEQNDVVLRPHCDVVQDVENEKEDKKKQSLKKKPRMKVGAVKARSMSSLLGQSNNDF